MKDTGNSFRYVVQAIVFTLAVLFVCDAGVDHNPEPEGVLLRKAKY